MLSIPPVKSFEEMISPTKSIHHRSCSAASTSRDEHIGLRIALPVKTIKHQVA